MKAVLVPEGIDFPFIHDLNALCGLYVDTNWFLLLMGVLIGYTKRHALSTSLFGLSAPSISRRMRAAAAVAGLGLGFPGHSGRVGMAQGRWKTARMVEVYTRSEEAGRAAKWLA